MDIFTIVEVKEEDIENDHIKDESNEDEEKEEKQRSQTTGCNVRIKYLIYLFQFGSSHDGKFLI